MSLWERRDQIRRVQFEMNSGGETAGEVLVARRVGVLIRSTRSIQRSTVVTKSAGSKTVGGFTSRGNAPVAAGQFGQCWSGFGDEGRSAGTRVGWSSPGKSGEDFSARQDSQRHVDLVLSRCVTEGDRSGVEVVVLTGTIRQMQKPGGNSSEGEIRSKTRVRSIAFLFRPNSDRRLMIAINSGFRQSQRHSQTTARFSRMTQPIQDEKPRRFAFDGALRTTF